MLGNAVAEGGVPPTPLYASAPHMHPCNWPKYQAAQKRALIFARNTRCQVMWMRVVDIPITGDDKCMVGETLARYRERWLQLHDMQPGGIMGICPLAWKMPMRCTRTLGEEQQVFKFTGCELVGWELHDIDDGIGRCVSNCFTIIASRCTSHNIAVVLFSSTWRLLSDCGRFQAIALCVVHVFLGSQRPQPDAKRSKVV